MTVQTNTYNVDYGKSSSIQTLMSSRAGTAQYHGLASGYYTYQGLTARGEYGVPRPQRLSPFHTTDLSCGVGGPIIPDKRFFFLRNLGTLFFLYPECRPYGGRSPGPE